MAPTTRSRGDGLGTTPSHISSINDATNDISSVNAGPDKKDKIYRKTAPKAKLQQRKFPPRATTVRAKKTAATGNGKGKPKRLSLPNPSNSARKGRKKEDEAEDCKQKTLTQMRWVPSTFPASDGEGSGDGDDADQPWLHSFGSLDHGEGSGVLETTFGSKNNGTAKTKEKKVAKKPTEIKKSADRGRKRRKTTGDPELELERSAGDEDEGAGQDDGVSSSKYHTQTLTQMPSWQGLSGMVVDSDDDTNFGFEDDLLQLGEDSRATILGEAPQNTKRKRTSLFPPSSGLGATNEPVRSSTLAPEPAMSSRTAPAPPPSTDASVIPETPHRPRAMRTEIPSSQPSPFTPNPEAELRYQWPAGHGSERRSPLKERSTNVDAPVPTPSAIRKTLPSEIPDSWSTVNGGMPSSGGRDATRMPLKELNVGDYSIELGESSDGRSQRTAGDVIEDSDDGFEGFLDDGEIEAFGTPTPQRQSLGGSDEQPTVEDTWRSPRLLNTVKGYAAKKSTSPLAEMVAVPEEVTLTGSPPEPNNDRDGTMKVEVEDDATRTPSIRRSATEQCSNDHKVRHGDASESPAEVAATPMPLRQGAITQQPSSHSATRRNLTPEPPVDEGDTDVETPSRPKRRPGSSSTVAKETPLSSPQKTSPPLPAVSQLGHTQLGYTQLGYKSQAFESQRVPADLIRQMAPQTDRSDVIVAADPIEVKRITEGACTHLFRDVRLSGTVARVWFYVTAPAHQLKYMASISGWKLPGDIDSLDPTDIDLVEFAKGRRTKFAYTILEVYQINNPVTLERMKDEGWLEEEPTAMTTPYVPPAPLGALMANLRCWLLGNSFNELDVESESQSQGLATVSQELEQQLMSDIEHSTQSLHGNFGVLQHEQPLIRGEKHDQNEKELVIPPSQNVAEAARVRATPVRTQIAGSVKQVAFAKPPIPPSRSQYLVDEINNSSPMPRHPYQSQNIIKSTVRPSQASTMSEPSQSQAGRRIEYCMVPDSQSPVRPFASAATETASSLPTMVGGSPAQTRSAGSSGKTVGDMDEKNDATQSSLGLAALLASSQRIGLRRLEAEQDSLLDDSKVKMPPAMEQVEGWSSDGDDL